MPTTINFARFDAKLEQRLAGIDPGRRSVQEVLGEFLREVS